MTGPPVLSVGSWRSNAHMIADVARLGYLDGRVLDATYGEGAFWRVWRPSTLTTNDLYKPADHRYDYRELPFGDRSFDAVIFDPPYRLSGRRDRGMLDTRYGTEHRKSRDEVLGELVDGAVECHRVASQWCLVKCQDQVEGGRVRWQTRIVADAVEAAGGVLWDRFDLVTTPRPQPGGRVQRTARRNVSSLLVFRRAWRAEESGQGSVPVVRR